MGSEGILLNITASAPGRSFPTWKVTFSTAQPLGDVLRGWANTRLGVDLTEQVPEKAQALASDGSALPLTESVGSLREKLRMRQGAYTLDVLWPAEALPAVKSARGRTAPGPPARSKLRKLHPSARYCYVDRRVMGWGSSSTHKAKIAAGTYADTRGHYPEAELALAMRTPPAFDEDVELEDRQLAALDDANAVLFHARLRGPKHEVLNWEATCKRCERNIRERKPDKKASQLPYPVFIPSCGRAEKAHLNWRASHVFGPQETTPLGLRPVVCLVIEPEEEEDYRAAWPLSLMLILPEGHRGPGYARWVVQRLCTSSCIVGHEASDGSQRRLQRIWIVDDTLTMFYRLALMEKFVSCGRLRRPKRMKHRVANGLMFQEALLAVQRHHFIGRAAVAGFLRDDGTAVCKRNDWKLDELALYKVVLLDLRELWRLNVEYTPQLQMYEDICLNHDVLSKGGRTLKCQCYGFRAVHAKKGGCLQQRNGRERSGQTRLKDLVKKSEFAKMNKDRQKVVKELLQWVRDKELLFRKRTEEPKKNAPTPPSPERTADNEADEQEVAVGDMTPGTPVEVDDSEASASEAEDLEMFADESSPPVLWPR
ncbi:unnamed protein product [Durusdinium trenchii]|uniref:TET-Associated Glycosyltransferase domain-containing protein n=2 Tax=Durusdinium trenchii TaxID=1381693 RepID=A0ABP0NZ90_9DINO